MSSDRLLPLLAVLVFPFGMSAASASERDERPGEVAFTFDCAQWGDAGLDHILEVLKKRKVDATFFVTGKFIENNPAGILKITEGGFEIANHSYEHDRRNSIEECNRVAELFHNATGRRMAPFFRAPYLHERGIDWAQFRSGGWEKGYVSLITCDALPEFEHISDERFLQCFRHYVTHGSAERVSIHQVSGSDGPGHINGASILMHIDGYRCHLLEAMIDIVEKSGYRCVSFSAATRALIKGSPFPEERRILPSSNPILPPDLSRLRELKAAARLENVRPDPEMVSRARRELENATGNEVPSRGQVAFTFDCTGYDPTAWEHILSVLKKEGTRSTFYITYSYYESFPGAVRMLLESGHEIACRLEESASPDLGSCNSFANRFESETGIELVRLLRFSPGAPARILGQTGDHGWSHGYHTLNTIDASDEWKHISDGRFIAYYKIYFSTGPVKAVDIFNLPDLGTGNLDEAVIRIDTGCSRIHLLEKMIRHTREKGYVTVPQSELGFRSFVN